MPKYLIERNVPGVDRMSAEEVQGLARTSCGVLEDMGPRIQWIHSYITEDMGPRIQWIHSYITEDRITCVYIAPDAETVRDHARRGGFPADRVAEIRSIIDPTTAEAVAPVG